MEEKLKGFNLSIPVFFSVSAKDRLNSYSRLQRTNEKRWNSGTFFQIITDFLNCYLRYSLIVSSQCQVCNALHTLDYPSASLGFVLCHPQDMLLHQHHVAGYVWYVAAQLQEQGHMFAAGHFQWADINHSCNNRHISNQELRQAAAVSFIKMRFNLD